MLTMSARMSVAEGLVERCAVDGADRPEHVTFGQAFWRARYHETEQALDGALVELSQLASDALRAQVTQTSDANEALISIESQGLEATTCAALLSARRALNGERYEALKATYAAGTTTVVRAVRGQLATARAIAGLIVLVMAAFWAWGIYTVLRWRRRLVGAEHQLADRLLEDNAALESQAHALQDQVAVHTQIARDRQNSVEALVRALLRTEQEERKRLARWVHDELQQYLVSTRMYVRLIRDEQEPRFASEALDGLEQAVSSVRDLNAALLGPPVGNTGLMGAVADLSAQAERLHQLTVAVEAPDRLPELKPEAGLLAYEFIREALFNVVKHADVGQARAKISLDPEGRLTVEVSDAGRGFEGVARGAAGADGTGLAGLRTRAEALGGALTIEAAPGAGSRIQLQLPDARRAERTSPPAAARALDAPHERVRVVIADDRRAIRQLLVQALLGLDRFEVVAAVGSGPDAVSAVSATRPAVVVMDYAMPGFDGAEATRRIRRSSPEIVVVGFTASDEDAVVRAMEAAGATACITKDQGLDALLATLDGLALG